MRIHKINPGSPWTRLNQIWLTLLFEQFEILFYQHLEIAVVDKKTSNKNRKHMKTLLNEKPSEFLLAPVMSCS